MCKGGVYYFTRHVPNDLQRHYATPRIVICLKTRSENAALKASRSMAAKLDDFWLQMRVANMDVPASDKLTKQQPKEAFTSCAPKLTDALQRYFKLKGIDKPKLFFTASYLLPFRISVFACVIAQFRFTSVIDVKSSRIPNGHFK